MFSGKDLAISMNLGGGVQFHFPGLLRGVGTHHEKISGIPVCLLELVGVEMVTVDVIRGMTRGLEHPRKGVVTKEPWG